MPWEAKQHNNQWCVFKEGESAPIKGGCHGDDKKAAEKHVAALYASEDKEAHEKMGDYGYPMFGVTSFAELDDLQQAEHVAHEMGELLEHFQMIAANIVADGEITDKAAALRTLTDEFIGRVESAGDMEEKQASVLGSVLKEIPEPDPELHAKEAQPGFMVWKDKDTGRHRWLAIYSNKYRDDDRPAEIISEKSHRMFAEMVRKGIVDYPELWQWHLPGTRWGEADWVDYTDNGFSMASGLVDEGCEPVAEAYAREKPGAIRVSHGMPKMLLVRDEDDPSVINFHVTTEISPLPADKAANPYTGFHVLSTGDGTMSLSDEQRKYLEAHGLKSEQVKLIAEGLTQLGKQAQADGRESKDKDATEIEVTVEVEEEEVTEEEAPQYVTRTEFDALRTEIAGAMAEFVTGAQAIGESVKSLQATVKALQADDGEKIAKAAADTPPASLAALIAQSVIGKSETYVDGRSKEAKDGPKETEAKKSGGLFFEEWMGGQAH